MRGVTIQEKMAIDGSQCLAFDLRDILDLFQDAVRRSRWSAVEVECVGDGAEELHHLADQNAEIDGETFLALSAKISQTIDGKFSGFVPGASDPWVIIYAVDSTCFDVWTENVDMLEAIKERFDEVTNIDAPG